LKATEGPIHHLESSWLNIWIW